MEQLIAIVDDDRAVRDALRRLLKSHGFTADVFASAEHFLDSPAMRRVSCLILDVRLPGMSGLALGDRLVSQGCRIPTILITACPTSAERKRALAGGAISYLAKPLGEQTLLDTIRSALGRGRSAARESVPT